MATVSAESLARAIKRMRKMDFRQKEAICDEIYIEQPNLLASVLVQQQMGNALEDVDVLLNILIVMHEAVKESGQSIAEISVREQERQLNLLTATIKVCEGQSGALLQRSLKQSIANHGEEFLLAYAIETMRKAGFFNRADECSKYLGLAGINLVNCIANAKRLN